MKGLFDKPRYRWTGDAWVCAQEDLSRLRWALPIGTLARVLPMPSVLPNLRLVRS